MRIIDVTVDFETVGLSNNAALIEIAAVAWNRDAESESEIFIDTPPFMQRIDLLSGVFNGREFDPSTVKWWKEKDAKVKQTIIAEQDYPEEEVLRNFAAWLEALAEEHDAEVVLWSQGSDFDIAILRNRCKELGVMLPVHFHNFRDARTFVLEDGIATANEAFAKLPRKDFYALVYKRIPQYVDANGEENAHEALYDAGRTSWGVWHAMHGKYNEAEITSVNV